MTKFIRFSIVGRCELLGFIVFLERTAKAFPYFLLDDKKQKEKKYYKYLHSPPHAGFIVEG